MLPGFEGRPSLPTGSVSVHFDFLMHLVSFVIRLNLRSNKMRPIGSIFGFFGLACSGFFAGHTADVAENLLSVFRTRHLSQERPRQSLNLLKFGLQSAFYSSVGIASFYILGGRAKHLIPSSLFRPGAFARGSLPATGTDYASQSQRDKLFRIGRRHGCHHCGKKLWNSSAMHADHIPPNGLNTIKKQAQSFFPQCLKCSSLQSNAVRTRTDTAVTGTLLRISSIWVPSNVLWFILGPFLVSQFALFFGPEESLDPSTQGDDSEKNKKR